MTRHGASLRAMLKIKSPRRADVPYYFYLSQLVGAVLRRDRPASGIAV